MARHRIKLDLRIEVLDDEVLALDPGTGQISCLTGEAAEALLVLLGALPDAYVPTRLLDAMDALADLGIVEGAGRGRRRLPGSGRSKPTVGIVQLSLPDRDPAAPPSTSHPTPGPLAADEPSSMP